MRLSGLVAAFHRRPRAAHARGAGHRRWPWWLALLLLGMSAQAQADLGSCSDPAYLQRFDERLAGYDCVVAAQRSVDTPEGTRQVRVLHHRGAPLDAAMLADARRGLDAAVAALGSIGRYALYDTSILLAHDVPAPDGTAAYALGVGRGGVARAECQIVYYANGALPGETAGTMAHELFHCVQAATFSPGQNKTYQERSGGAWWTEGSAVWFSSLALPDPLDYEELALQFADLVQTKPLYRHDYPAVVFFLWLAQADGPHGVLPFLAGMPQDPSDSAQRIALRDALGEARWMQFAQALADNEIRRPHGPQPRITLALRNDWAWNRDRTDTLQLKPFTIVLAVSRIDCGQWEPDVSPASGYASRRRGDRGHWGPLPARIGLEEPAAYVHLAAHTGDRQLAQRFAVRQLAGCSRCASGTATDACLVGTWRVTGGGSLQWLRDNMPSAARFAGNASTAELVLQRDGMFRTGQVSASISMQPGESATRAEGDARLQASGRWSAADGQLNMCMDLAALDGEARLVARDETVRMPLPPLPPSETSVSYTCSGDTLRTTQPMPRHGGGEYPPMETIYTRVPGAAP